LSEGSSPSIGGAGPRSPALPVPEKLNIGSLALRECLANVVMARGEARARKLAARYDAWVGSIRSGKGAARDSPATRQRDWR
jgi:hypothetical protein